ncbi:MULTISPECIES: UDP-glucose dehydrogenase family protein [unclassified Tenacibaculum]|uniref:UDP-glucose dehydrogenase family protein n=1 Tax=unclassified Tenacibaculum TaxID=2635139 RepID=UPI001F25203E|nr:MULTISPECIES: UDP-glucose/GDP-mannose dehydrogenase family protein [unclassified Tenacibaculum]MCF2876621.1 UDP-glucose/GDP-mannose dehydrogenase family protein [Tenacibaculum sp. Cn5-1]MCF2936772.1 UDP-glucose/GDP-mannose dehydrogenase family protein [Tenacibaculum sp. Cn5-34]MCG7512996.1 UDP-glucose/GDP-mannose dehydrogenase family protein [Tenacibaculum sp. Cn5-46]
MNIAVIGTGYVGLVSGTCFSEMGNKVTCVDIDQEKIDKLHKGIIPIYEPGLEKMVLKNVKNKNLLFTTKLEEAIEETDIVFIAVGTPMGEDGSADLQYVLSVAKEIGQKMNRRLVVVDKSTVPVGTADKVKETILEELKLRNVELKFDVVSNPEFLKEGDAINDFMKPDRVVIGAESDYAFDKMRELYSPFTMSRERFIGMDIRSAEMTKYAANAMLATKISFMNEMANICERVGADINNVRIGIGSDSRIGYSFIYPGAGYGGSCFPKDVKALKKIAEEHNYKAQLIESVELVNNRQKYVIADKVVKRFGEDLAGKVFGLWGLAFKPGTDDMREAPAIYVVKELIKRGAKVQAYDPKAIEEAKHFYLKDISGISYANSKYEVLRGANALILLTEWKEFRSPDFEEIKNQLVEPIIFDGRNQYIAYNLVEKGIEYYRIGKE